MNTDRTGLDPEVFRHVIGHFASGVTIITTRDDDGSDRGMTANAVTSLSLEPPMLLVCLNAGSTTRQAVSRTGAFAVNILAADQGALAGRFARSHADKFAGVPRWYGPHGQPLLRGALAHIECEVTDEIPGGTHRIFLATVSHAQARDGSPLTYFRGTFGRFTRPEESWRGSEPRAPARRPVDPGTADHAFKAKLVIDLGVARLVAGRTDPCQVAELRRLAEAMLPLVVDGRITDIDAYIRADVAFHEYVIRLASNDTLVDAYRRLSIADIIAPALTQPSPLRERLTRGRLRLADAYESGDLERIENVITDQYRLSSCAHRDAVASACGG